VSTCFFFFFEDALSRKMKRHDDRSQAHNVKTSLRQNYSREALASIPSIAVTWV
jgi:hypothetical protein